MEKPVRLIIAGGRDFKDYDFFRNAALDFVSTLGDRSNIEIVSGGAKGVDAMGERFAKEEGLALRIFPADWSRYGRAAGPIRNEGMAIYSTHLLSYWNGVSKGTKSMISLAKKEDLIVKVVDTSSVPTP